MPTAVFTMPNGRDAEFDFPEGTTPQQAQAFVDNWWKEQSGKSANYGLREDGTAKGPGWLGEIPTAGGDVMTEKSATINIDGKERLVPLLVPGLTKEEIKILAEDKPLTKSIIQKAAAHAKKQIDAGLSPFIEAQSAVQFPQTAPNPAEGIDPGQAALIGVGRGMVNVGRGIGLVPPETDFEKQAMEQLAQAQPFATSAGQIAGESAPFLPLGMGVGAIPSTAGRILGGGALGALEGGILAKGQGGDVAEGAGLGLLAGAGSEVVIPVLTGLAGQVYRKVTGKAPAGALINASGAPTAELSEALSQAGVSFDELSNEAIRQVQQSGAIPPEQAARLMRARTEGVPLSTGEVTQNFAQRATEERLLGNVGEAASESFRQFKLGQSQAIESALRRNFTFETGKEEAGTLIKDALTGRKTLLRAEKNDLYKAAYDAAKDKGGIPFFTENISAAIPDEATLQDLAITAPSAEKSLRGLLERYGLMRSENVIPENLTVENFERFRKGLNAIERGDTTGAISTATKPIKEALDREADELVTTLKQRGVDLGESVFGPLEEARKTVRTLKTEFSSQSVAGRLTDLKPDGYTPIVEASKVYDKLAMRSTPVEDVRKVVASLAKAPDGEPARAALKSTVIMDLIDAGFGTESRKVQGVKIFNPTAFKRRLNLIGKDKIQAIFSDDPAAFKRLVNIDQIASDLIPPDRAVPKGSADVILDLAGRLGLLKIAQAVPGGTFFAEAIRRPVQSVRSGVQASRATAGAPDVQRIRGVIDRTFPSFAAALGIASYEPSQVEQARPQPVTGGFSALPYTLPSESQ